MLFRDPLVGVLWAGLVRCPPFFARGRDPSTAPPNYLYTSSAEQHRRSGPSKPAPRPPVLHALLHRKLDPAIPEPKRLEDVVTSTVFGTLLLAGADETLAAWFATASRDPSGETVAGPLRGCWFWPRMVHAEPDVVLALGAHLVVVEAKVRSGRNDLVGDDDETTIDGDDADTAASLLDQIGRQWESLRRAADTPGLPDDLRTAAHNAKACLFYLVDARRLAKATRQIQESRGLLPDGADVRILTWQSLHRILHRAVMSSSWPRWARDLVAYLEYENLAGFVGFTHMDAPAVARAARRLQALALVRGDDLLRWDQIVARKSASPLFNWACPNTRHALWSLLRMETTARGVMHAAGLVLSTPIARGPSPALQHTRGGTS